MEKWNNGKMVKKQNVKIKKMKTKQKQEKRKMEPWKTIKFGKGGK